MINLGTPDKCSPGDVVLCSMYGGVEYLSFWCPACQGWHSVNSSWSWNMSLCSTTINPSIKVTGVNEQGNQTICHLYVRDGWLEYLGDCTHQMANQKIKMSDVFTELGLCESCGKKHQSECR